ncbi:MAG: S8 family serine peptidase [Candidatus Aenigmarchaeota archaeon]|nr:S8 family serine peptidase [Candidatus Aenigmarchaeota archaeon]
MRFFSGMIIAALMITAVAVFSAPQPPALANNIFLKSRTITNYGPLSSFSARTGGHYIIQFSHVPTDDGKAALEANGILLLSYLPDKAWYAYVEPDAMLTNVTYLGPVLPNDKLPPMLQEGVPDWMRNGDATANLSVTFFPDVSPDDADRTIEAHGGIVKRRMAGTARDVQLPAESLHSITNEDGVKWVENSNTRLAALNDGARNASGVTGLLDAPYHLNGTGVVIAEWDQGWAERTHSALSAKTTRGDDGCTETECADDSHATHVAGTMLANGSGSNYAYRGMAPNATLITYEWPDDGTSELYNETNLSTAVYNASVSQNSWGYSTQANGCGIMGDYTAFSAAYDNIIHGNQSVTSRTMTIVFAAGNDRSTNSAYCGSQGHTYNTTTGPGGTAKNTITVGAVDSDTSAMTSFSSWGPTDDGRIKPDVVAPGCENTTNLNDALAYRSIWSTITGNTYSGSCGTSMAAPVVSGIAALIYQDYRQTFNRTPLPSTVKALLVHTARDVNNTGPDYTSGYGIVNATAAIAKLREDNRTDVVKEGNVSQNTAETHQLTLSGRSELKITLAWDDYQGDPNAANALVNDLDLLVYTTAGTRFFPWTLDKTNPATGAVQTQRDALNNIEQVYVANASSGTWNITINGTAVPNGPQNYSLVISVTDTTLPEIRFLTPTPGNSSNISSSWVYINATSNEVITGAVLEWNNGTVTNFTMSGNTTHFFYNATSLDNRTYSYKVFVNDTANNTNVSDVRYVTVDTIVPQISISLPANLTYNYTPSLNFSASDAFGRVDRCWFALNRNETNATISSCQNLSLIGAEGFNNLTVYVNDTAGNTNSSPVNFTIDTVLSVIMVTSPKNTTYNYTNFTLNYSVTDVAVSSCWFLNTTGERINLSGCINATFNATPNSQSNITVYVNDTANNTQSSQIFFSVDMSVPNITAAFPLNQTYNYTPGINFTVTNAFGALDNCWYTNVTASSIFLPACANISAGNFSEGMNVVRLFINDTGGNLNSSAELNFTIDLPPRLSVQAPLNSTNISSTNVTLNYTVGDTYGIDRCWLVNTSGSTIFLNTGPGATCANITFLGAENQPSNITVSVNDTKGSVNWTQLFFTVDGILPFITFESPTPNATTNASTVRQNAKTVLINISGNENLDTVTLEWNGANESMAGNYTSWSKNKSIATPGSYTFKVWANDTAGNRNVSESRTFNVTDTVKPEVTASSPTAGTYSASNISLNFTAGDNFAVDACWYRLNGGANTMLAGCANITFLAATGGNTVNLSVNDTSGNRNETSIAFTYTEPTTTTTTGGGGSAAPSATTNTSIPQQNQTSTVNITANGTAEINVSINGSVTKIVLRTLHAATNVKVTVKRLAAKPAGVAAPAGAAFEYLDITAENLSAATIDRAAIQFNVSTTWLSANNVTAMDVLLKRYSGSAWENLTTTKLRETASVVLYEATTPGFSTFAIVAEKAPSPLTVCGNSVREGAEQCDGTDLAGQSCSSKGFANGTLRCTSSCAYDTSVCMTAAQPACGNGVCESGENATCARDCALQGDGQGGIDFIPIVIVIAVLAGLAYGAKRFLASRQEETQDDLLLFAVKSLQAGYSVSYVKEILQDRGYDKETISSVLRKAMRRVAK